MALVTVADLREYMSGISLSAAQIRTAQGVLDGVQQTLETYLNRPVQPMHVRERRRSNPSGDLVVTITPVYKVISVQAMGQAEPTEYTHEEVSPMAEEDVDRMWDAMPLDTAIVPGGIYVGNPGVWYTVEYVGGYNGYIDASLKLAILEVASRIMTANHDDTLSLKEGMVSAPPQGQPQFRGWTIDELVRFDRLRRRTVIR